MPILLALVVLANALPALLGLLLGPARPLDGGRYLPLDGRPLLGSSKTWRGLVASLVGTSMGAWILELPWTLGLEVAAGAMVGDLAASFVKRRLGRPPSTSVPLLDQVPESLLPALAVKAQLALGWLDLWVLVLAFIAIDIVLTQAGRWASGLIGRFKRDGARGP
jgi:CDP-2,3-bis-(O-geranylgeranyl)-sn-glycerol synthase